MNRTIKDATAKRIHSDRAKLQTHLADAVPADNFAHRLKTLNGLTAYEYIREILTSEPHRYIIKPSQQRQGLNNYATSISSILTSFRQLFDFYPIKALAIYAGKDSRLLCRSRVPGYGNAPTPPAEQLQS